VDYLLITLAVFWIFRFLINLSNDYVEAAEWFWQLVLLGMAALALAPWDQSWVQWFSPLVIAGGVTVLRMIENLLIVKADEALTVVMRATARRPR
jgi:hypothetical protein